MATGTIEIPEINIAQETKTFTVKQVWEAIKQNGLVHLRDQWYVDSSEYGNAKGGCALGQAGYNLGVPYNSEQTDSDEDDEGNLYYALNQFPTPTKWDQYGENAAEAIVGINDAMRRNVHGNYTGRYRYNYSEIVRIAGEILEPHFDKTITLPVYRY